MSIGHQLWLVFNWPFGIVVGNILSNLIWTPIAAAGLWLARDRIGRRLAAWLHKHYTAHLARLEEESKN